VPWEDRYEWLLYKRAKAAKKMQEKNPLAALSEYHEALVLIDL
jgi:hypothetical protein